MSLLFSKHQIINFCKSTCCLSLLFSSFSPSNHFLNQKMFKIPFSFLLTWPQNIACRGVQILLTKLLWYEILVIVLFSSVLSMKEDWCKSFHLPLFFVCLETAQAWCSYSKTRIALCWQRCIYLLMLLSFHGTLFLFVQVTIFQNYAFSIIVEMEYSTFWFSYYIYLSFGDRGDSLGNSCLQQNSISFFLFCKSIPICLLSP